MSQNIFQNPYVFSIPTLTANSVGNGTLTIDRLTHFTVDQKYTVICSAIAPFTVFNVVGSLDGAVGVAVVEEQFTDEDNKVFFTIQQGPTLFQIGDTFEFEVRQGTDLNQQNLDAYDELPQKNFGTGITGSLKGNHNIRFNPEPTKARKEIDQLLFEAKDVGTDGNSISIEYIKGSVLTAASLTLQGVTFTAVQEGQAGNNISIEFRELVLAQPASVTIGTIGYEAESPGTWGNSITIEYVGGGTAGSEVVSVVGNAITVQIEDGVTTSDDIEVAIALHAAAAALVETISFGETGAEPQSVTGGPIPLTGGTDQAGDTVVVEDNHIIVSFENEVTTAQQIADFVNTSVEALSLVSAVVTGVPETAMFNPVAPTFLSGGADNVGDPGNEIIEVEENAIKITFADGLSTAAQIKASIEANVQASALVDITLLGDGTELQSSPKPVGFMAGGSSGGNYAFNVDELEDAENFFEGNAPILHNGQVNQGDELTIGETIKKGKVTLDDDIPSNVSGPKIENTQQTINSIIQNGKAFIVTVDNSKVAWYQPELSFTADIAFVFPDSGFINKILVANSPITIEDGEHAYVVVDRFANVELTIQKAEIIPTGENVFRLFSRRGDDLIWYDNSYQKDKKEIRIGEGGSGGTAFQEVIGTGNGLQKSFPLTFIPSNEQSILVICSHIKTLTEDYVYNLNGNQIDFVEAPAPGQDIYVFYLTDGDTLQVPSPDGFLNSYIHTVTNGDVYNKEITLQNIPAEPSKILVDLVGGIAAIFNEDYTISVNKFQWAGYGLDGLLAEGDRIRFFFYS